jgi:hypothetical protein
MMQRAITEVPTLDEFLAWPSEVVRQLVYPRKLGISLLLNGTRRWYLSQNYETPPTDLSYLPGCLDFILSNIGRLLEMLAEHGFYRTFLLSYSREQLSGRDRRVHEYLIAGIAGLTKHERLLQAYSSASYAVRFYGDSSFLPPKIEADVLNPPQGHNGQPKHFIYYGLDADNPNSHVLDLAYHFGIEHGRPPTLDDMLELYYGDRTMRPLDILVSYNKTYDRGGIPPLLNTSDRIYTTVVTPLVLSETGLRHILYDFLFSHQDRGRTYTDINPNEFQRLKQFYEVNRDTVIGLTQRFEDLVYPVPAPIWPEEMTSGTSHLSQ